ncbi:hypothetical protein PIN31009_01694 [Pandoraea iniqua]|uniref:Uncharacterized protein n=1 Tax=Pandoraea iniqua TaxID=2508288 RepID=A0A5E4TXV8_9BURK|nr:hypothetical protein [Pandoraea iniqua]VVD92381.1 hypothetical protein PIN31009_01694 [Pandoraea iniqua]VVD96537.1 hypothetical protein PIN31115_01876 [Pandoraea iniqua]
MAFIAIACPNTVSVFAGDTLLQTRREAGLQGHRPVPAHGIAAQALIR